MVQAEAQYALEERGVNKRNQLEGKKIRVRRQDYNK